MARPVLHLTPPRRWGRGFRRPRQDDRTRWTPSLSHRTSRGSLAQITAPASAASFPGEAPVLGGERCPLWRGDPEVRSQCQEAGSSEVCRVPG